MVIVVDGQADVVVELHLVLGKPWSDEDVLAVDLLLMSGSERQRVWLEALSR